MVPFVSQIIVIFLSFSTLRLREACARARNAPKIRRCMSVIIKTRSSASLPGEIHQAEEDMSNASVAVDALAAEVRLVVR